MLLVWMTADVGAYVIICSVGNFWKVLGNKFVNKFVKKFVKFVAQIFGDFFERRHFLS